MRSVREAIDHGSDRGWPRPRFGLRPERSGSLRRPRLRRFVEPGIRLVEQSRSAVAQHPGNRHALAHPLRVASDAFSAPPPGRPRPAPQRSPPDPAHGACRRTKVLVSGEVLVQAGSVAKQLGSTPDVFPARQQVESRRTRSQRGRQCRAMSLSSVVLPAPLGPRIKTVSPRWMVRSTGSRRMDAEDAVTPESGRLPLPVRGRTGDRRGALRDAVREPTRVKATAGGAG